MNQKIDSLSQNLKKNFHPISVCKYCKPQSTKIVQWGPSKKEISKWV
jgi:hypothetical protein